MAQTHTEESANMSSIPKETLLRRKDIPKGNTD